MLSRFALTPETLAETHYPSREVFELGLDCLRDLCRSEGLFANLREGHWSRVVEIIGPVAKHFLSFARKEGRLISVPQQLLNDPKTDEEWLWEAQKLHHSMSCRAIITQRHLASGHEDDSDPYVTSLEHVNQSSWWINRSNSRTVQRSTHAYMQALALVLQHANSLMFIDPHIDPCRKNYDEFPKLLLASGANGHRPLIEIHRASWRHVNGQKEGVSRAQWISDFSDWDKKLERSGLKATVFLWEKIHDRFLISNLVGINIPYGFDVSEKPLDDTVWTRLGSADRDLWQRKFDRNCSANNLVGCFEIGCQSS